MSTTFAENVNKAIDDSLVDYIWLFSALAFATPANAELMTIISRMDSFSMFAKWIHGYSGAVIVETGIFILAVKGRKTAATFFMIYSIYSHILFFHMWDEFIELYYGIKVENGTYILSPGTSAYYMKLSLAWTKFLASLGVSVIVPVSIKYFSDQIAKKRTEGKLIQQLADLETALADAQQKIADTERILAGIQRNVADAEREKAKLEKAKAKLSDEIADMESGIAELKQDIISLKAQRNASLPRKPKQETLTQ